MRIFPFRWSFSLRFKGALLYFIMIFILLRGKRRNGIWIPSDEEGERMGGKPARVLRGKRTQGAATAVGHGEKRWQNTGRRFLRQLCDDMVAL